MKNTVANLADLMDRQMALLVDARYNHGLPANLSGCEGPRAAINHGLKALQISSSAWTAEALKLTMQLALWPVEAVAASLPNGWRIEEAGMLRRLYLGDELVTSIAYSAQPRWSGTIKMDNLRYKYRLTIQSAP